MNYSLLRYPGGKTRAVKYLEQFVPKETTQITSPFFGGGSFEISLANKGVQVFGYDIFQPLVSFWQEVLSDPHTLSVEIQKHFPLKKDQFYEMQKQVLLETDRFKQAAMFYVLNRSSFSGTGLSGGMSPNHTRFNQASIGRVSQFRSDFQIECETFHTSLYKHEGTLVYADPPYAIDQKLYGVKGDTHQGFDHEKLAEILNDRGRFLLSYNNSEKIRDLYSDHKFYYPEWNYGMNKSKVSNEILIVSKDIKR